MKMEFISENGKMGKMKEKEPFTGIQEKNLKDYF
jgi:hypothetical protein